MSHSAYHSRRKEAALPRWRRVVEMRKTMKLREIAAVIGCDIAFVHRMEQKWHSARLSK